LKKIVWLAVGVLAVAVGIVTTFSTEKTVTVKTKTLTSATLSETVACKGKVEKTAQTKVTLPANVVVGEVRVSAGDTVKKGDVLFTVDTASTLQKLADTDGAAAVQAAMSGVVQETVTAPCDGLVSTVAATQGTLLEKGVVAAEIAAQPAVCIRLSVPERHIREIAVGQQVTVTGVGFHKDTYTGTVTEIASTAKQAVNGVTAETVVEAVVTLDAGEIDDSLRVGLNAKGAVTVSTVPLGFVLPYAAVEQDENSAEYVYILKDGKAEKRTFTPLAERVDGYLVTEGFADGEQLILTPELVTDADIPLQTEAKSNDRTD